MKLICNLVKYFNADPRPYLVNGNIKPVECTLSFGNPSGHSMASSIALVVIMLDVFHGSPTSINHIKEGSVFYSNKFYYLCLLLGLYW